MLDLRWSSGWKRAAILLAFAAIAASPTAASSIGPFGRAVVGQSGQTHGRHWRVLFSSHGQERCFALKLSYSAAQVCGTEPDLVWRRVIGNGIGTSPSA